MELRAFKMAPRLFYYQNCMHEPSAKRRNTRENLFSFGNIKGRNAISPCADKYRIVTEPTNIVPLRQPRQMHSALQEINYRQLTEHQAMKTPSFFQGRQKSRQRIGTDLYESDADRYESRYSQLSIDKGRYSYNPTIEEISQKYGFRQKQEEPRGLGMRSMSQQKINNYRKAYEPQKRVDHISKKYTLFEQKPYYKPEVDPQTMLNSINDLSDRINQKMKCLLSQCDDMYDY